jgi:coenzyme F420-reducing hydrogenase alpha subunit
MALKTMPTINIDVHHLTRVEGHGNLLIEVQDGVVQTCKLEIIEAPRYFEAMLKGQHYAQAPRLAGRICGICSVAHTTASLQAIESALQVRNSAQTILLRRLNFLGEMLDSHILHIYMLVAPDLLGLGSVLPLVQSAPEVLHRALRMKKTAGDLCAVIGGRHTHPISMTVGGFTHLPASADLETQSEHLQAMRPDVEATITLFQGLPLPDFERDTEYLALTQADEYALLDGDITSTDGGIWPVESYQQVAREYRVSHSTAKFARHQREAYMVGALARFNLNYDGLHPAAKSAAAALGIAPLCTNPYKNTLAQLVEVVHCYETALQLIEILLDKGIEIQDLARPGRISGEGIGAVEAPRGTLYHHYRIRGERLTEVNCIIPTGQNLGNIEADLRVLVPTLLSHAPQQIAQAAEMLVRAYDPCISCSTHMVEVKSI